MKAGQKQRQRKLTEYAYQLIEKQKTKKSYGLREAQFRKYFDASSKFRGKTGEVLLQTLERRLDNVLFRSGFAKTRKQARQIVNHRRLTLNGTRVGIPSIQVTAGDVIAPHKGVKLEFYPEIAVADWLKVDKKTAQITVKSLPEAGDLPIEFDTQKIIEFYSR